MADRRFLWILTAVALLLLTLPYLYAFQAGGTAQQFSGFLVNPIDGHTYLAKMREGFKGNWKFTLPYSANGGDGAYLFLFYILLGHLAKLLKLPLIDVFHGARILASLLLIYSIWLLSRKMFDAIWKQRLFLVLAMFGSGLGWIGVLWGKFTSDFWVAEAYPFLSMYTNPHFTIGLALMILALLPEKNHQFGKDLTLGLLLGVIQPFGVVIIGAIKAGVVLMDGIGKDFSWKQILQSPKFKALVGFSLGGGPVLIYQYYAILSDSILAEWHAQNITPAPDMLDLLISLSPCLILAALGILKAWKSELGKKALLWSGISLVLLFIPWGLQRRFITGIYLPLALLSVFGIEYLSSRFLLGKHLIAVVVLILALPTNILVLLSGVQAVRSQDPSIFINNDTKNALTWIGTHTAENALLLSEPDFGLLIPSETGRRVVYGHPFETIHADRELAFLNEFYSQDQPENFYLSSLKQRSVDYFVVDSFATGALRNWAAGHCERLYHNKGISIYEVPN